MQKLVSLLFCGFLLWVNNPLADGWKNIKWFQAKEQCEAARPQSIYTTFMEFHQAVHHSLCEANPALCDISREVTEHRRAAYDDETEKRLSTRVLCLPVGAPLPSMKEPTHE